MSYWNPPGAVVFKGEGSVWQDMNEVNMIWLRKPGCFTVWFSTTLWQFGSRFCKVSLARGQQHIS